jgi:hypothetical protein
MDMGVHDDARRYTVDCMHCARTMFTSARRIGEIQLMMIETHLLVCRPLATLEGAAALLGHCRVRETTG